MGLIRTIVTRLA